MTPISRRRVLVADPSPAMVRALSLGLGEGTEFEVTSAPTLRRLLESTLADPPAFVLLDDEFGPELGAEEILGRLRLQKRLQVIVYGRSLADDVARCRGLKARGCAHLMNRPNLRGDGTLDPDWIGAMHHILRSLTEHLSLFPATPTPIPTQLLEPGADDGPMKSLVVIGASTGGPEALTRLLAGLPVNFPVPIVIAQHIPKGFSGGLADSLGQSSPLPVIEAHESTLLEPGTVVVAPGGRHLAVRRGGRVVLTAPITPMEATPSVDILFRSAAAAHRRGLLAVILTGMGNDGSDGVRRVRESGGTVIAQNEATSTVFGMPREAIATGCVDEVLALDRIARRVTDIVRPGGGAS